MPHNCPANACASTEEQLAAHAASMSAHKGPPPLPHLRCSQWPSCASTSHLVYTTDDFAMICGSAAKTFAIASAWTGASPRTYGLFVHSAVSVQNDLHIMHPQTPAHCACGGHERSEVIVLPARSQSPEGDICCADNAKKSQHGSIRHEEARNQKAGSAGKGWRALRDTSQSSACSCVKVPMASIAGASYAM